ncbi:cobalamin-dependent protein [Vescimonas sp.]|uniref:cobalamin-dependent protein n=1 Tax=Vescimonas sp. TaxID=2892404 RepID=UPI0030794A9B
MQTPKEIFLELLKPNGRPERVLKQYEALHMCLNDPINTYLRGNRRRGSVSRDRWGTTISFPADAPGAIPVHTDDLTVCPDVTHWEETVHAPDLAANCAAGWEDCRSAARSAAGEEKLLAGFMGTGIFEQCHFLMGFENTLTALYEHPDEMHRLIDYITDYRLGYVKLLIDNLHPDVIFSHDDWGTKDALFMHPDMWRAFFKEPYRRFYGYIRSRGCIAIHHADSYLVPIVDDMAEIGIQVWQGVLPENDIPALQRHLQGKLVLMGGIGAAIDRSDATAGEVCDYTRRTLRTCCPGGHFIPSITYGLPGAVYPHIDRYIDETIDAYNAGVHLPVFPLPPEPRRSLAPRASAPAAAVSETPAEQGEDLLAAVAAATKRGQQKKLLALVDKALSRGISAQDILSGGLIKGMNDLGEDFSASRAFVPEMLMAARCMSAATAQLKPHLVDSGGVRRTIGSACIGTVRGDMHDIGKNLVKIMLEGSNIEVYDLGADVAPETFIQAAREHHCDIIACSALLTTTMQQMRRVVELAWESGIRDRVCIMVGGAPISQSFCDEIHADLYTPDAASAARAAVDRLTHPAK